MTTLIVKNGVSLSYVKETLHGSEFVTHKIKNSEDGTLNKYWGHYFTDFDKAKKSFVKRQH